MGIVKMNDGTWTVSVSKRNPKTKVPYSLKRIKIASENEAKKVEKQLIYQLGEKIHEKISPKWKIILAEFEQFQTERGISLKTISSDMYCLKKYSTSWDNRQVDTISKNEIRTVLSEQMADRRESHKKHLLKCFRAVFNFCLEKEYVSQNPTPLIKFKLGEKIQAVLTETQASKLLEKAREYDLDWYPIWAMALYTGMRNGELYALSWDCISFEQNTIRVCRSWNNKDGFKSTKSGDDRVINISPALLPVIRDLYANRICDFVLPRLQSWDRGEQARELRAFLMGIGLSPMRFHDLRATWATLLLSKGIEPVKVMKMGGWKDLETMMIYTRKAGIDIRGATDCLALHSHHQELADVVPIGCSGM